MDDRLEIAAGALKGLLSGEPFTPFNRNGVAAQSRGECVQFLVEIALDYADELIKQHALTKVALEKREHEK